jgi:hypothetical protein
MEDGQPREENGGEADEQPPPASGTRTDFVRNLVGVHRMERQERRAESGDASAQTAKGSRRQ